ncbi:MAG: DUF1611 domain-containing protein [Planctomycetia bacterium]|jgi:uncharacterized NAD-dependent epimerase/dehydratase family protein
MTRRIAVLTEGFNHPGTAKLGAGLVRFCPEDVLAVIDSQTAGKTYQETLGVGGDQIVLATLDDVQGADTLFLGTAPPGGKIPTSWRPIILDAIRRGMNVVSGMHEFLNDDPQFVEAAKAADVKLVDLRATDMSEVATGAGFRKGCLRLHTVANATSCGKMTVCIEVVKGLQEQGLDAAFVATGQCGISISGHGCPVDRVISDFVAGAAENLVHDYQDHDIILVEGQGSLIDYRYSSVTLGLLHGCRPDGLIFCYQMGRGFSTGDDQPDRPMPPLSELIQFTETAAGFVHPARVIGVAINGQGYTDEEVDAECRRVEQELGLPACDVFRHGPGRLVEAIQKFKAELGK